MAQAGIELVIFLELEAHSTMPGSVLVFVFMLADNWLEGILVLCSDECVDD